MRLLRAHLGTGDDRLFRWLRTLTVFVVGVGLGCALGSTWWQTPAPVVQRWEHIAITRHTAGIAVYLNGRYLISIDFGSGTVLDQALALGWSPAGLPWPLYRAVYWERPDVQDALDAVLTQASEDFDHA